MGILPLGNFKRLMSQRIESFFEFWVQIAAGSIPAFLSPNYARLAACDSLLPWNWQFQPRIVAGAAGVSALICWLPPATLCSRSVVGAQGFSGVDLLTTYPEPEELEQEAPVKKT